MKRTTLYERHVESGARMVEFAGWMMPLRYQGIILEHTAVRTSAGLFDIGHMGEILVDGSAASDFVQYVSTNDVRRLQDGQAQYSALAFPEGTVVDDFLVYRINAERYMLVVNAANIAKDLEWLEQHNRFDVSLTDVSEKTGLLAVQGPAAMESIRSLTSNTLEDLFYFHFRHTRLAGVEGILSRTGYTGEDGFEFYCAAEHTPQVWDAILEAGSSFGVKPAGLGARNTLRLEASLLLHGNDMDETTTLFEAGLGWIVKLDKSDFIGRESLIRNKVDGIRRRLVGFEMLGRDIARERYLAVVNGREVGYVSSGGPSITLKKNIGLAYLPIEHSTPGSRFEVSIRKRLSLAQVVSTPFYQGKKHI